MSQFDPNDSIGAKSRIEIFWYLFRINTSYLLKLMWTELKRPFSR